MGEGITKPHCPGIQVPATIDDLYVLPMLGLKQGLLWGREPARSTHLSVTPQEPKDVPPSQSPWTLKRPETKKRMLGLLFFLGLKVCLQEPIQCLCNN